MSSLRSKIFRYVLRTAFNFNPLNAPDAIRRIRKLSALQQSDKTPRGFKLSKEKTENGTLYERVLKNNRKREENVVLYFHGGAFVSGILSLYRKFAPDFFKAARNAELIFLDYDVAPESLYPKQLEQAVDLWNDLVYRQGYLPEKIIFVGDSAGANLALATMLKLRDKGRKLPLACACISLWGDLSGSGESYRYNYRNDVLFGEKKEELTFQKRLAFLEGEIYCYAKNETDKTNPYLSPTYGDYFGFPPMYFNVGGHEMLLSDTLSVVKNLQAHGVDVECEIGEEMFHCYMLYKDFLPEGKKAYRNLLRFIKERYAKEE